MYQTQSSQTVANRNITLCETPGSDTAPPARFSSGPGFGFGDAHPAAHVAPVDALRVDAVQTVADIEPFEPCHRGDGFHAERRGQGRTTGLEGLPPIRADRETTSRRSPPPPASRYAGGMAVAGDLPVFAGETFAYALAGVCVGRGMLAASAQSHDRHQLVRKWGWANRSRCKCGNLTRRPNSNGALIQT